MYVNRNAQGKIKKKNGNDQRKTKKKLEVKGNPRTHRPHVRYNLKSRLAL
jgi:hypothetical protein